MIRTIHKRFFICGIIAAVLCTGPSRADTPQNANGLFESEKILDDKSFVPFDFIEFSIFDMAEMTIINDTVPPAPAEPTAAVIPAKKKKSSTAIIPTTDGEREVRENMVALPKLFYKSLRQEILKQKVPVTLYPKDAPGFSKPLTLFIKVKSVHLIAETIMTDGRKVQSFTLRIYGQLKEKGADAILFKYYDSFSTEFAIGQGKSQEALARCALTMMRDLATHLKSKY